jgi:single-strand DNA-binding protein
MAGVNKVILVGNLGKDPEIRHLEGGVAVANFTLATSEYYKDKSGNRIEQTEWHSVVVWRGLADVAEKYLKKGMTVYVEGKIRSRSWDDKEGVKHYKTEIVGDALTILSKKENNQSNSPEDHGSSFSKTEDDLPF